MLHTCLDHPSLYCPECGGVNAWFLEDIPKNPRYLRALEAQARVDGERILAEAKAFNRKAEAENERLGVFKRRRAVR